jgi:glycosyltransferase involved in cell wall biosynthesis
MTVQVLLSTYNGTTYLRPLMESLLAQDYPQVEIFVRDDGSSDGTINLLQEYATSFSNVTLISGENLGAARSFLKLLEQSSPTADYMAFCDQDDVWLKDKISRAIEWLHRCPQEIPTMYCSRVAIVTENLQFIRYSNIPKKRLSFPNALVECLLFGCTMVINQAARQLLLREFPRYVRMYDGWIYIVISAFGSVLYDDEPRILHRRHTRNFSMIPLTLRDRLQVQGRRFLQYGKTQLLIRQAEEFKRIYGSFVPAESRQVVGRFLECRKRFRDRLRYALTCDVYHQSTSGHLMLRLLIVLNRVF